MDNPFKHQYKNPTEGVLDAYHRLPDTGIDAVPLIIAGVLLVASGYILYIIANSNRR